MHKIVTFGEMMLRLQPQGHQRFTQANLFEATYGGGEANVAVSLSVLGEQGVFCSKFPSNPIGDSAICELRKYGVDTSHIARGGSRLGIYFLEKGASQRASKVVYDRAFSAISEIKEGDIDVDKLLEGADWFHFTGITPALSADARNVLEIILKAANEKGIKVSCDLIYRNKLWSKSEAKEVMTELMKYTNILIANEEDTKDVFAIGAKDSNIEEGKLNIEGYKEVAETLISKFNFEKVAFTLRESISASVNDWSAMLVTKDSFCLSNKYHINIVDRVGGGDSFAAGLIYGILNGKSDADALEFAVAASCLKHSIEGDINLATKSEIESLVKNGGSGRVQR